MPRIRSLITITILTFCAFNSAIAQEVKPMPSAAAPAITFAASTDRVRFTGPNSVVQMHLQVYDNAGQLVFDVSSKGNVLDWTLQDSGGARLISGSYLSVVTVKSLSGKLSQRIGSVAVQEKQLELQPVNAAQLTAGQQQAVGPIEENGALTILQAGETEAATVVAHDGTQGELTRSRGALSFRLGDFFSGNDEEQMRLTEEGNLGIGTDNPQAKLDVAGVIRTSKGIEFDNGTAVTKLTTTATGSLQQTLADGTVVPNATGTGTQNKLAKWTDNAGTLGDSVVTEASGNIGIGTPSPQAALHVIGNQFLTPLGATPTYKVLAGSDPSSTVMLTTDSSAFGWQIAPSNAASDTIVQVLGQSFAALPNRGEFGIYLGANSASAFKVIQRGGPELMRVNRTGDVGIGTPTPAAKLDVAGKINTSTQYDFGGQRVLGVSSGLGIDKSNTFTGIGAGAAMGFPIFLNTSTNNSFYGKNAGFSNNDGGSNNSFFGALAGENALANIGQSFFGASAGRNGSVGNNNTFIGANADFIGANNNQGGDGNTLLGTNARISLGGNIINNSTAIGAGAVVTQSNSLVLGSINGVNGATAYTKVGIGTTAPTSRLHVIDPSNTGLRVQTNTPGGTVASFGDKGEFRVDALNIPGGRFTIQEDGNIVWANSQLSTQHGGSLELGGTSSIAGTDSPYIDFHFGPMVAQDFNTRIINDANGRLSIFGLLRLNTFGNGSTNICLDSNNVFSMCSSSSRYKQDISRFSSGLELLRQLRPVTFRWKEGGQQDLGLIAEEVNEVEPLLTTRNKNGEIEGVKYNQLSAVFVNAFQEQQRQIQQQDEKIRQGQLQITQQQQQLQQKHVRIEKLEARLAALETVVKNMSVRRRPRRR